MSETPPPTGIKLPRTFRGRFAALRNVWPFLKMVWKASSRLMMIALLLRVDRAVLPVIALWFGKRFKNPVELSGGEWQKVAIVRADMRGAAC